MNETSFTYFYMSPISGDSKYKPIITAFFFLIYVAGVVINSSMITVICLDVQLHKPMYLFICHLSIVDIFYTSVTVPKLLYMLLSGDHLVPSAQCYAQLCFFLVVALAEDILLFIMAYDRYVAICFPLHYHQILRPKNCLLIMIGMWAAAILNSLTFITLALYMSSCPSCTSIDILMFVFIPVIGTIISYVNIFSVILKMKSKESQKKAFSTCSSHVTVITIYYGAGMIGYFIPPYSKVLDSVFNIIYSTIIPMINPVIYSLQNSGIKSAFLRLT